MQNPTKIAALRECFGQSTANRYIKAGWLFSGQSTRLDEGACNAVYTFVWPESHGPRVEPEAEPSMFTKAN